MSCRSLNRSAVLNTAPLPSPLATTPKPVGVTLRFRPFFSRRSTYSLYLLLLNFLCALGLSIYCQPSLALDFTEQEIAIIDSLRFKHFGDLPASPGNPVADSPRAAALGKLLFFERKLSAQQKVSCASCHQVQKSFTDGLKTSIGENLLKRNAPSIIGAARSTWQYWDGRRDSLWAQALVPFEAGNEMGSDRVQVVRKLYQLPHLKKSYVASFGALPEIDWNAWPEQAGPLGNKHQQEKWRTLSPEQKQTINQVFANLGRAIEAFERKQDFKASRFDRFADALVNKQILGVEQLLSPAEQRGLKLFINEQQTQCLQCHNGPSFSNQEFHNINSGSNSDIGRAAGVSAVLLDEFNCLGPYSQADAADCQHLRFLKKEIHDGDFGAYKTPTLRNIGKTAPYFHDGRYENLFQVIMHYVANGSPVRNTPNELRPIQLSSEQVQDLMAFLFSLNGE